MALVWIGALLMVLKWLEIDPVAQWSWWWILLPLALAFAWFEVIQPLFGFDQRKKMDDHYAKLRRKRIAAQFPGRAGAVARKRPDARS